MLKKLNPRLFPWCGYNYNSTKCLENICNSQSCSKELTSIKANKVCDSYKQEKKKHKIDKHNFEDVTEFVYLGVSDNVINDVAAEIRRHIMLVC